MAKINGSNFLVYSNGTLIAAQKSCTVSWEQDLPPSISKDSAGWEEHILGVRRATCDFDGLVSTTGLSAEELADLIISRTTVILVIDGMGIPIVGEAEMKSFSVNGAVEEAGSLSGSFKFNGPAWILSDSYAQLITDIGAAVTSYDTFNKSGATILSAINLAGTASTQSNSFSVTSGDVIKVITYVTKNSGDNPSVEIIQVGAAAISNIVVLTPGVNIATLTVTSTQTGALYIFNTDATNFSTTIIYAFKV